MRLRHGLAGEPACHDVYTADEAGLASDSLCQAKICQRFDEGIGDIDERLRCRSGIRAGHVGHAIMDDPFFDKNRMIMSCGARGLGTTSLIDGDVDKDASAFHALQHLA